MSSRSKGSGQELYKNDGSTEISERLRVFKHFRQSRRAVAVATELPGAAIAATQMTLEANAMAPILDGFGESGVRAPRLRRADRRLFQFRQ